MQWDKICEKAKLINFFLHIGIKVQNQFQGENFNASLFLYMLNFPHVWAVSSLVQCLEMSTLS